jgi:hypothetical protein
LEIVLFFVLLIKDTVLFIFQICTAKQVVAVGAVVAKIGVVGSGAIIKIGGTVAFVRVNGVIKQFGLHTIITM